MTPPEIAFWLALRRNDAGLRFRRQHPAGPYILDFYCATAGLAVEVDGEAHSRGDRPNRDAARDTWLADQGLHILRYPAAEVLHDVESIVRQILAVAAGRTSPPSAPWRGRVGRHPDPPPPGGGGRRSLTEGAERIRVARPKNSPVLQRAHRHIPYRMTHFPDFAPVPTASTRSDGWTPARQRTFIVALSELGGVAAAARAVGMTPQSANRLRRRPQAESFAAA